MKGKPLRKKYNQRKQQFMKWRKHKPLVKLLDITVLAVFTYVLLIAITHIFAAGIGTMEIGRLFLAICFVILILRNLIIKDYKLAIGCFIYGSVFCILYFTIHF